ncbi:MAG: hypothetical protein IJ060_06315 [Oscillospiraceae bacterium]|nr:hypothetical protein [Oscillospiraceae bacterium]
MIEANKTQEYAIPCPKCGKEHCFMPNYNYSVLDSTVSCECGYDFYVFASGGFRIIMPKCEAESERIVRAMRKFVVATGRCPDISPELYEDIAEMTVNDTPVEQFDIEDLIVYALEQYQTDAYGDYFFTLETLDDMFELLTRDRDVLLTRKKNEVEVKEQRPKNRGKFGFHADESNLTHFCKYRLKRKARKTGSTSKAGGTGGTDTIKTAEDITETESTIHITIGQGLLHTTPPIKADSIPS